MNFISPMNLVTSLFYRTNRSNNKGSILMWITVNGVKARSGLNTGVKCYKDQWNGKGKIINHPQAHTLNESLFVVEASIRSIANTFQLSHIAFTANDLVDIYRGKKMSLNLKDVFDMYMEREMKIKTTSRVRNLNSCRNRITEHLTKLSINSIEYLDTTKIESIYEELISKGVTKSTLKQDINFLVNAINNFVEKNKIYHMRVTPPKYGKRKPSDITFLDDTEVELFENYIPKNEHELKAKNWFLLSCYTGMHFNECKNFDFKKHYKTNAKNQKYILIQRDKTSLVSNQRCTIPLIQKAIILIEDYFKNRNLKSDYKQVRAYNYTLNNIAKKIGIDKHVTSKIGRKTFGTLMILKGMTLESVSKMLGHASVITTQNHYAIILEERIFNEFEKIEKN
ncbi:site-specific integrase [Flammeovirga sp. EKP202]|uniref:tyrosine-type recombinase/integrase n=1 Tax=Flammeovirga sp. EKP202 TaxID=2770592 RepID=UPI00165FAA29|nr:site-specific integrase [Flammeovirga sp. EKP202]MBD0403247.1 integrase catalytic domain-containing protein [Flammeovirga sp. EKP202]